MNVTIRVLIVDDSEDDALLLADELLNSGYSPTYSRVDTLEAMRRAVSEETWEIIIADYNMPQFSGPDALRVLHETGLDIPFILVSGTAADSAGVDMMRAGAQDFILKHNLSRLAPAVTRELREAENRRLQRQMAEREKEREAQMQDFYRRTILAATDGKLLICEKEEIESILGASLGSWSVAVKEDLGVMRDDVSRMAREQGMEKARLPFLLGCMVEAAANAIKHANGGLASFHRKDDSLVFMMSDSGPGIGALSLPDVALVRGYSTAGTLGMGYKIMIQSADRVYLATGPQGTTVAIEIALQGTGNR